MAKQYSQLFSIIQPDELDCFFCGESALVCPVGGENNLSITRLSEAAKVEAFISRYLGYLNTATAFANVPEKALRMAKLQFLETAERDVFQTPYYWAVLVFMGEDARMDLVFKNHALSRKKKNNNRKIIF